MPTFASLEDLRSSLRDAGVGHLAADMVRTVRPDLLFWRRSVPDSTLPVGVSKIGGHPDLPPGFDWPFRGPLDAVEAREASVRRALGNMAMIIDAEEISRKQLGRFPFFRRPFPLAFVAQIDLGAMALEAGFDDRLPDTGLLSVFYDITDGYSGSPRLFWHDGPRSDLAPRTAPQNLIDYYQTYGSHLDDDEPVWPTLTHADTLHPVSGLSVPEHWRDFHAAGTERGDAVNAWFDGPEGAIAMDKPDEGASFYGDHLGGWPSAIQHHPEIEIDDVDIERPGETPWRHVLSLNVGECQAETRLMALDDSSDGQHYIFLHEDDLDARRLDRARTVHQMT